MAHYTSNAIHPIRHGVRLDECYTKLKNEAEAARMLKERYRQ